MNKRTLASHLLNFLDWEQCCGQTHLSDSLTELIWILLELSDGRNIDFNEIEYRLRKEPSVPYIERLQMEEQQSEEVNHVDTQFEFLLANFTKVPKSQTNRQRTSGQDNEGL